MERKKKFLAQKAMLDNMQKAEELERELREKEILSKKEKIVRGQSQPPAGRTPIKNLDQATSDNQSNTGRSNNDYFALEQKKKQRD